MNETLPSLIENSFQIAWDYLEATGELGNPDAAARHLLDTIEVMIRQGREAAAASLRQVLLRRPQRFRAERGMPRLLSGQLKKRSAMGGSNAAGA